MRAQHIAVVAATLFSTAAFAKGKAPQAVATVEGLTEYDLDNGLRVVLFPDPSAAKVTVNVTYLVGSRNEGYGETGMAHILEHLTFKKTQKYENVLGEYQKRGGMANGTTSFDRTNYFVTVPAEKDNLDAVLDVEADRMARTVLDKKILDTEFSVVRNEFEMGENSPENILEERMLESAFLWHNYGHPTIGSRSDIERVPIERLRAFYSKYYRPDNAMLVIAGKFDPKAALALVEKHFGVLARPKTPIDQTYTVEPVQDGERGVILRRTGDVAVVAMMYHAVAGADAAAVAADAAAFILSDKPTGRLYKALVETGLASEVSASADPTHDPGVVEVFARVQMPKDPAQVDAAVEKVRRAMVDVVEGFAKNPVTDEEVKRYQARQAKGFELLMTRPDRIGIVLTEFAAVGDWRLLFVSRDRARTLKAADVQAFATAYLKQSNRTVGEFIPSAKPERAPLPPAIDVAALVKDYKGDAAVAAGESFAPTVANIEKRTTRSTLPGGMKVALLPKSTRGKAVSLSLLVHYGTAADLKGHTTAAALLPDMLLRGTKKHSYQQIKDELDRLKADLRAAPGEPGEARFTVTTVRDNLADVVKLLAEIVEEPAFPPSELEVVRKERLAALEEQRQDPQAQLFVAARRAMHPHQPDDVRYVPTIEEAIERTKKVSIDELAALHKNTWGAGDAELAVVGDFDAGALGKLLATEFGAWKAPRAYARVGEPFVKAPGLESVIKTPDKQMAVVFAGEALEMRDDDADYPALVMAHYVLGGNFKSRLVDRLRQKEGVSYGAGDQFEASPFDKNAAFAAFAICAPQNAAKAMTSMLDEIGRLVKDGVPQGELDETRKGWMAFRENLRTNDSWIAGALATAMFRGRTLDFDAKLEDRVAKLSPKDVSALVARYTDIARLVKLSAGDLK